MTPVDGQLHDKEDPLPWAEEMQRAHTIATVFGPAADKIAAMIMPSDAQQRWSICVCNGCGRWQEFPVLPAFEKILAAARAAGWRRHGTDDLCPICTGN